MDAENNITISQEVSPLVDMFDCMSGQGQLELIGLLLEKMENEEIELNGKPVTPEDIGIDDTYACCATILDIISRELTV